MTAKIQGQNGRENILKAHNHIKYKIKLNLKKIIKNKNSFTSPDRSWLYIELEQNNAKNWDISSSKTLKKKEEEEEKKAKPKIKCKNKV